MRKMVFGRKLSRSQKSRRALFRSLIRALVVDEKLTTTKAKAKAIIAMCDKMVNTAKLNTLSARRRILSETGNQGDVTEKLFSVVVPSFTKKSGGYLRIIPQAPRKGDMSEVVKVEWTETLVKAPVKVKKAKKVVAKKAPLKTAKKVSTKRVAKPAKKVAKK